VHRESIPGFASSVGDGITFGEHAMNNVIYLVGLVVVVLAVLAFFGLA
jgi:hypothetical protein